DAAAHWFLPARRGPSGDEVRGALARLSAEGDSDMRVGLAAAEAALNKSDARIKHVVLLTDGWATGGDGLDIAQRMRDAGITLSVVAAGSGSSDELRRLAAIGGGRYYPTDS